MTEQTGAKELRVAKLVRVSTTHLEQADSPQHQLAYIEGEIRRAGWQDTGLVYRAELTGAVIVDRPEIQRMLRDGQEGRFDAIVLKSVSRLGRDTLGLLMVKRMLDDMRAELIALADGYRSFRDPELIFLVHAERAQAGRQEISKNVKAGVVEAARRGIWPAGTLPFGLHRRSRFAIEPDPETAPIVALIFSLRRQGWGLPRICAHLNREVRVKAPAWWHLREQIRRLEGSEGADCDDRIQERLRRLKARLLTSRFVWHPRTVRLILQNPAYHGALQYNRTASSRRMHGRLVRERRDQADWVTIPCPALITREAWQAVQRIDQLARRPKGRAASSPFLLSGLAVCGQCGGAMRAQSARHNTGRRGGELKGYYVCRASIESGLHPAEYLRAQPLEEAVLEGLRSHLRTLAPPRPRMKRERTADPQQEAAALQAALDDLAEALFFRREALRLGQITPSAFDFEADLIRRKELELSAHLAQVKQGAGEHRDPGLLQERIKRLWLLQGPVEAIRQLLSLLVERVVIHAADDIDLHVRFTADE